MSLSMRPGSWVMPNPSDRLPLARTAASNSQNGIDAVTHDARHLTQGDPIDGSGSLPVKGSAPAARSGSALAAGQMDP
jgi:hypothetical protein